MTGSLIDPEGRCERCGRLVPIECPEPDGLSCGSYVLEVTAGEGDDVAAAIERLRAMLPPSPRDGETSIGYEPANDAGPPPDLDVPPDEPETIDEDAFFSAMDDLVEHVTGTRPGARGCEADDQGPEDGVF